MGWYDEFKQNDWFRAAKDVADGIGSKLEQNKHQNAPAQQASVLNNVPLEANVHASTADINNAGEQVKKGGLVVGGVVINPWYVAGGLAAVLLVAKAVR